MSASQENAELIDRLLQKTALQRLRWEAAQGGEAQSFSLKLEDVAFIITKADSPTALIYVLTMVDKEQNILLQVTGRRFSSSGRTDEFFEKLALLFEAARRSAFSVDEKLRKTMDLLDRL